MTRYLAKIVLLTLALTLAASAADTAPSLKLPPYKKVKLKNGMTIAAGGTAHGSVDRLSGHRESRRQWPMPQGKDGTASITANLLRKGTKTRTGDQFSSELDFIGGQFNAEARQLISPLSPRSS